MRFPIRNVSAALFLACGVVIGPEAAAAEPSLAEQIKRFPPVEPQDAPATFEVQHGFRIELVAAEPLVSDPVDACFDEYGRMYVAEMHGYPYSFEPRAHQPQGGGKKDAGMVRLLEDTDGDGTLDRSTVFAKDISWPTSVCCYNGGVLVLAPLHLYYFKDTNGDGVADVREIVYSGFGRENVQAVANNLKWGLDNRIYGAGASNPVELSHRGDKLFTLGRRDFAFDPKTEEIRPVSGGSQFGHSMDDWGNRFLCSNSNHIQHVVFEQRYLDRNPHVTASGILRSIAVEGPAAPVFRRSLPEPWRVIRTHRRAADPAYAKRLPQSELVPTGFFTSATGVTIYRGAAYPEEFRGNAFVGDVGGNLIHRKTLTPAGATFVATRADRDVEFVASTDSWFRPVNFVNAPDGTLYVLDMYRETIEHPVSIPEDIKVHLDLESGDDRGRIYRLAPPNWRHTPPPKLGEMTASQLVAQLQSANSWNRETAQRLLWERQDAAAVEPLRKLVRESRTPQAKVHALWCLDGLSSVTADLLLAALHDDHPRVREHALRVAEKHHKDSPKLVDAMLQRVADDDYRVRLQLAFTLGELPQDRALPSLVELARRDGVDRDLRTAILSSVREPADFAAALAAELAGSAGKKTPLLDLLAETARMAGSQDDARSAVQVLQLCTDAEGNLALQQTILRSLGEGLSRRGRSLSALLAGSECDPELREDIGKLLQNAAAIARDGGRSAGERRAAVGLLAFADTRMAVPGLTELLGPGSPQQVQIAAVEALSQHRGPEIAAALLEAWRSATPALRSEILDALLSRADRVAVLLDAIEAGRFAAGEIERDRQQLLQNHPNDAVRKRARTLLGAESSSDRAQAVAQYESALDLEGNAERGRELYRKHCSVCHKVGDEGHVVGPDLASTKNKSPHDLLIAILDPGRELQPNYTAYNVVTVEGTLLSGIIAEETGGSITLRRAEGKQDVVLRDQIEILASSGKSLMPEGLEKDVTPQQMADLLAFVRSLEPPSSE